MILDTNALSAFADGIPPVVQQIATADELHVPVIVLGDYRFGIATSGRRHQYEAWLARGRAFWNVLPIVEETATHYASIRQHDLPVLSRDAHFDAVSGLTRLSWR